MTFITWRFPWKNPRSMLWNPHSPLDPRSQAQRCVKKTCSSTCSPNREKVILMVQPYLATGAWKPRMFPRETWGSSRWRVASFSKNKLENASFRVLPLFRDQAASLLLSLHKPQMHHKGPLPGSLLGIFRGLSNVIPIKTQSRTHTQAQTASGANTNTNQNTHTQTKTHKQTNKQTNKPCSPDPSGL